MEGMPCCCIALLSDVSCGHVSALGEEVLGCAWHAGWACVVNLTEMRVPLLYPCRVGRDSVWKQAAALLQDGRSIPDELVLGMKRHLATRCTRIKQKFAAEQEQITALLRYFSQDPDWLYLAIHWRQMQSLSQGRGMVRKAVESLRSNASTLLPTQSSSVLGNGAQSDGSGAHQLSMGQMDGDGLGSCTAQPTPTPTPSGQADGGQANISQADATPTGHNVVAPPPQQASPNPNARSVSHRASLALDAAYHASVQQSPTADRKQASHVSSPLSLPQPAVPPTFHSDSHPRNPSAQSSPDQHPRKSVTTDTAWPVGHIVTRHTARLAGQSNRFMDPDIFEKPMSDRQHSVDDALNGQALVTEADVQRMQSNIGRLVKQWQPFNTGLQGSPGGEGLDGVLAPDSYRTLAKRCLQELVKIDVHNQSNICQRSPPTGHPRMVVLGCGTTPEHIFAIAAMVGVYVDINSRLADSGLVPALPHGTHIRVLGISFSDQVAQMKHGFAQAFPDGDVSAFLSDSGHCDFPKVSCSIVGAPNNGLGLQALGHVQAKGNAHHMVHSHRENCEPIVTEDIGIGRVKQITTFSEGMALGVLKRYFEEASGLEVVGMVHKNARGGSASVEVDRVVSLLEDVGLLKGKGWELSVVQQPKPNLTWFHHMFSWTVNQEGTARATYPAVVAFRDPMIAATRRAQTCVGPVTLIGSRPSP